MNMPEEKKATYNSEFRTTLCQTNHSFVSQTTTKIQLSEAKSRKTAQYDLVAMDDHDVAPAIVHMALNF